MLTLLARRILQAVPTLWLVATATFFLLRLAPGGPFDEEKPLAPEVKAQIEAHYGLDKPLYEQYFHFLGNLLQGDLGPSYKYPGWDVQEIIAQAFPASFELGCWALCVALLFGIPAGIWQLRSTELVQRPLLWLLPPQAFACLLLLWVRS